MSDFGGFLEGYLQADQKKRTQAVEIANQVARQHSQQLEEQRVQIEKQAQDDRKVQQKAADADAEFYRKIATQKQTLDEKKEQDATDDRKAALKAKNDIHYMDKVQQWVTAGGDPKMFAMAYDRNPDDPSTFLRPPEKSVQDRQKEQAQIDTAHAIAGKFIAQTNEANIKAANAQKIADLEVILKQGNIAFKTAQTEHEKAGTDRIRQMTPVDMALAQARVKEVGANTSRIAHEIQDIDARRQKTYAETETIRKSGGSVALQKWAFENKKQIQDEQSKIGKALVQTSKDWETTHDQAAMMLSELQHPPAVTKGNVASEEAYRVWKVKADGYLASGIPEREGHLKALYAHKDELMKQRAYYEHLMVETGIRTIDKPSGKKDVNATKQHQSAVKGEEKGKPFDFNGQRQHIDADQGAFKQMQSTYESHVKDLEARRQGVDHSSQASVDEFNRSADATNRELADLKEASKRLHGEVDAYNSNVKISNTNQQKKQSATPGRKKPLDVRHTSTDDLFKALR